MTVSFRKRPYRLGKLLASLGSINPENNEAVWERSLGEQAAKFYGQHVIQAGELENSAFIPTRSMIRDLLSGTASAGGDLVATSLEAAAASVRPVTVLEKAGVERIETGGENLTIPRFAEADAGWISENAAYTALTTTTTSVELIKKGAIQGTGTSNQPLGLLNLPNKLTKTFTSATPTSSELVDMLELVADADVDPYKMVWLLHPSMAANLRRSEISSGSGELILNFIGNSFRLHGVPVLMTTNIPEGKVLLFDPSYTRLVYFGAPQLVVDPFRGGISGTTQVQVLNAMDLAVTHESSVCVGSA